MKVTHKAKLKVVVFTSNTEVEANRLATEYCCEHGNYVIVNVVINQSTNGAYQTTVALATEYDAAEFVLKTKKTEEIRQIALYSGVITRDLKRVNVPVSREDVERQINDDGSDERFKFIRHNLHNLFAKGATSHRKQVFANYGVDFYKQTYKTAELSKTQLINKLLVSASNYNYANHAYEIMGYFMI